MPIESTSLMIFSIANRANLDLLILVVTDIRVNSLFNSALSLKGNEIGNSSWFICGIGSP
tara:strand:- start:524 stop:703 length:180 start_codon:yes stop_codon:yes gene_type:complete